MDRDEFMELVYETFADEPDNVLANGIIEAADAYVEHEKAQLFSEGATKDAISRQAALEKVRTMQTYKLFMGDDMILVDKAEVQTELMMLPTIQPVATDTNVGDKISRQAAIDAVNNAFDRETLLTRFVRSIAVRAIRDMPPVQPEPTDEQVMNYCKKRCLHIVSEGVFQSTHLTHKVSFGDKDHVWIDGKQYIHLPRFQEAVKEAGPKEGEWVQIQRCTGDAQPDLECPFCKHKIGWFDMGRYCAGCGAKLKGGAG